MLFFCKGIGITTILELAKNKSVVVDNTLGCIFCTINLKKTTPSIIYDVCICVRVCVWYNIVKGHTFSS